MSDSEEFDEFEDFQDNQVQHDQFYSNQNQEPQSQNRQMHKVTDLIDILENTQQQFYQQDQEDIEIDLDKIRKEREKRIKEQEEQLIKLDKMDEITQLNINNINKKLELIFDDYKQNSQLNSVLKIEQTKINIKDINEGRDLVQQISEKLEQVAKRQMNEIQTMIDIGIQQQKSQKLTKSTINLKLQDNEVKVDKKEDIQSYEHVNQDAIVQKKKQRNSDIFDLDVYHQNFTVSQPMISSNSQSDVQNLSDKNSVFDQ